MAALTIDQWSSTANWSPSTLVRWGRTWQGCHTCGKGTSEGPFCLSCRFPGGINQVEIYASKVQITELGMKYVFLLPEQNSSEPYLQQKALAFQVLSSFSDAEARDGFCSGVSGSSRFWTSCGSLRIQMCRCPEGAIWYIPLTFDTKSKQSKGFAGRNLVTLFVAFSMWDRVEDDSAERAAVSHSFMWGLVVC